MLWNFRISAISSGISPAAINGCLDNLILVCTVVVTEQTETGIEVAQESRGRETLETIGRETLVTCTAVTLAIGDNRDSVVTEGICDSLATEGDGDTLATGWNGDTLATEGNGNTLATGGNRDSLATEGDGDTLATGGNRDSLATEGDETNLQLEVEKTHRWDWTL